MIDEGKQKDQAINACYTIWDQEKSLKRYSKLKSFIRFIQK